MSNKYLISVSVPVIDIRLDLNVPNIVKVGSLKKVLLDYIFSNYNSNFSSLRLIDRDSGIELDSNLLVKDTSMCNGCSLILI